MSADDGGDGDEDEQSDKSTSKKRKGYNTDTGADAAARRRERDRLRKRMKRAQERASGQQDGDNEGRPRTAAGKGKKKAVRPFDSDGDDDILFPSNWGSDGQHSPLHVPGISFSNPQFNVPSDVPPYVPPPHAHSQVAMDERVPPAWTKELKEMKDSLQKAFDASHTMVAQLVALQNQSVAVIDALVHPIRHLIARVDGLQTIIMDMKGTPKFAINEYVELQKTLLALNTRNESPTLSFGQVGAVSADTSGTVPVTAASQARLTLPAPSSSVIEPRMVPQAATLQSPPSGIQAAPTMDDLFKEIAELKRKMSGTAFL
jgi:hypothetical protein